MINKSIVYLAIALACIILIKYTTRNKLIDLIISELSLVFSGFCLYYAYLENNIYCYAISTLLFIMTTYKLYRSK